MGVVLADDVADGAIVRPGLAYWSFFDPAYLFLTGGYRQRRQLDPPRRRVSHAIHRAHPDRPGALVSRRRPVVDAMILTAFASAPLAACLAVPEPYAIDRELELLPFGVLIAARRCAASADRAARAWRTAGAVLLAAVPLHFAFFSVDYYRDYPRGGGLLVQLEFSGMRSRDVLALERQWRPPAIYLSTHHVSNLDAYWRLYLHEVRPAGSRSCARSTSIRKGSMCRRCHRAACLLVGRDDTALAPSIDAGLLRRLATIPEPADPPFFSILVRIPAGAREDSPP